jgi:N-acetylmuramoyl-L-alanine amidase
MTHPRLRCVGACGAFLAIAVLMRIAVALDATAAKSAEQPAVGPSCQPALFKVALDIGHYRANPGAISATGVPEFEYNLSLAHAVIAALQQAGFTAAFLIGERGTPLPPDNRPRIAKDAGAVLFLSLHHDSVQSRYLSEWTVNGRARHYSDVFHGYSVFIAGKNRREHESKQFATLLGEAPTRRGPYAFLASRRENSGGKSAIARCEARLVSV